MKMLWFKLYVACFRLAMYIAENKIDIPPIEYVAGHVRYVEHTICWSTENGKVVGRIVPMDEELR
jgi:hypothetical protein